MGRGKHHIGDFLPPDELERFMETFTVGGKSQFYRGGDQWDLNF